MFKTLKSPSTFKKEQAAKKKRKQVYLAFLLPFFFINLETKNLVTKVKNLLFTNS